MENKICLDLASHTYYFQVPAVRHQQLFGSVFAIDHFIHELCSDERISLYGYCLFDDEIHLLLTCKDKPSQWFDPFLGRYNLWHQTNTGETGYLFDDLNIARVLIQPKYTLKVLRFLHQLPVLKKISAMPSSYPYSSYQHYLHHHQNQLDPNFVLSLLSHQKGQRLRRFEDYTNEPIKLAELEHYRQGNHPFYHAFADEQFVTKALAQYQSQDPKSRDKDLLNQWENCIKLLQPITELSADFLQGTARHHSMPDAHYLLAWTFVHVAKGPLFHVARQFKQDETTVALNIKSIELHHPASFLRYIEQRWRQIYAPTEV